MDIRQPGIDDFLRHRCDVVWHGADLKDVIGTIPYQIFGGVVSVPGLTHAAGIDNMARVGGQPKLARFAVHRCWSQLRLGVKRTAAQ